MTFATTARPTPTKALLLRRPGFTLVELLVVIGIIAVLAGILVPVTVSVIKKGFKARTQADLQAISAALEAYKGDFYDYPRPNSQRNGAQVLCKALIAPGPAAGTYAENPDGNDGPGFRVRAQGRVYGPYLQAEKFVIIGTGDAAALGDRNDIPILYYPAFFPNANISAPNGFVATNNYGSDMSNLALRPLYNSADGPIALANANMSCMLGDNDANGKIDVGETPVTKGAYILWAAGTDLLYGPATPTVADVKKADDVLVFGP